MQKLQHMISIRDKMEAEHKPLIAIVGPTASGKTDLAIDIAREINGEIICADSRTVYRHMDIGTAKPTPEQQAMVPHHLLDIINPNEVLSAGEFQRLAEDCITQVWQRGAVPLLVGGSGLYIDSVLYSYQFPVVADPKRRQELNDMDLSELVRMLMEADIERSLSIDLHNKRRVVRALETLQVGQGRRQHLLPGALIIGLEVNKDVAHERIRLRVETMLQKGFIDEVRRIGERYGFDGPAMNVIGYRALKPVVLGEVALEVGQSNFVRGDMALYKKQTTWFKRNQDICWVPTITEAKDRVRAYMADKRV